MDETLLAGKSTFEGDEPLHARRTFVVGSINSLTWLADSQRCLLLDASVDVVIIPTGGAFSGATALAVTTALSFESSGARVEALMITSRPNAFESYFVERISAADVVVLTDGSALHVRATLHETPVAQALASAPTLIAVGATATVLGYNMIDPRGGAPTAGLRLCSGAVLTTPTSESQLRRTRQLVGSDLPLIVVGSSGVVMGRNGLWFQLSDHDVSATRGSAIEMLESLSSQ